MPLATQFITLNIPLGYARENLVDAIEAVLAEQGEPLRWAITQVDVANQIAVVEAVVTIQI